MTEVLKIVDKIDEGKKKFTKSLIEMKAGAGVCYSIDPVTGAKTECLPPPPPKPIDDAELVNRLLNYRGQNRFLKLMRRRLTKAEGDLLKLTENQREAARDAFQAGVCGDNKFLEGM